MKTLLRTLASMSAPSLRFSAALDALATPRIGASRATQTLLATAK